MRYLRIPFSRDGLNRGLLATWQERGHQERAAEQLSFEFQFEAPRQPVQLEFRFPGTGDKQQTGEKQ